MEKVVEVEMQEEEVEMQEEAVETKQEVEEEEPSGNPGAQCLGQLLWLPWDIK